MKRLAALLILTLICCSAFAAAPQGILFTIRFYDQRIYYLGDEANPVTIEATLTNNSAETFRFKMANNRTFNLDFEATTPTNVTLDHSKEFTIARQTNQPLLFREVSLEPGEKYGIVVRLPDFIRVEKPGLYTLRSKFYPELNLNGAEDALHSNILSLNIRPAVIFPEERAIIEAETGQVLKRQAMPPDEVVTYTLSARQKSQWEKFFLYLDLERLYQKKPERGRRYRNLSEEERLLVLKRFKEELKLERVDRDILIIPSSFEVEYTNYTPFEATVMVQARFQHPDYTELKRYTFTLERRDRFWIIVEYFITNLGTE